MVTHREDLSGKIRRPNHSDADIEKQVRELSLARGGNKLMVPEGMALEVAIRFLQAKRAEEDQIVDVTYDFDLTVPEGAIALYRTLDELYGFVQAMTVPGFFGDSRPTFINVQLAKDKTVSIPWGQFKIPGVDGHIKTGYTFRDGVPYFQLNASVPGRCKPELERINQAVRARKDSVYQGSAISLSFPTPENVSSFDDFFPRFIEVQDLSLDDLVFSDDVEDVLTVSLFTPILHTAACREHNIPLKRGVLLEGPYGVGKTLTASVTASLAQKHGWTFIHLPKLTDLHKAYAFAKHHQPAVIFCEDLDEVLQEEEDRDENINAILNSIDGIESKGVEIITVFTTNDVDGITKAMLRPGRIDTVVPVRAPDAKAAQRLIRHFAKDKLEFGANLTVAGQLLAGKNAAMVREVVERSKLGAVSRLTHKDQLLVITASDIEVAARGMEAHNKLLEPEPEDARSDIEKAADRLGDKLLQLSGSSRTSNGLSHGEKHLTFPDVRELEGPKGTTPDAE